MNAVALVIGNDKYALEKNKLDNAANDANSISDVLLRLGYTVHKKLNCDKINFANAISQYITELNGFEIGLFYFSGHGLQIDGENYLAPIDTDFSDEKVAKYTSFPLQDILHDIDKAKPKIKIIILDACRNNPYPLTYRGAFSRGLAPIYAPKGTIIAFSTSPGEVALDGGSFGNSIYTRSILKHIEDKNTQIEDFFKRVRTSVYVLSEGKQLSWEHTSLIGDYYFNSGQLIHGVDLPYSPSVVADSQYIPDSSIFGHIIQGFKSHDWYKQGPAFKRFLKLDKSDVNESEQFLLGRNILQIATGGEFNSNDYFETLNQSLEKWIADGANHILNGILFEIYFDSDGRFRQGLNFKSNYINEICRLEEDKRYKTSFDFILTQLLPFRDFLYYIPSSNPVNLPIELKFEKIKKETSEGNYIINQLNTIFFQGTDILQIEEDFAFYSRSTYEHLVNELSKNLCVPKNRLTISTNFDDIELIIKPSYYKIATK
ncbi:MAG: caspase family protein [Bacteroidales bacterium]